MKMQGLLFLCMTGVMVASQQVVQLVQHTNPLEQLNVLQRRYGKPPLAVKPEIVRVTEFSERQEIQYVLPSGDVLRNILSSSFIQEDVGMLQNKIFTWSGLLTKLINMNVRSESPKSIRVLGLTEHIISQSKKIEPKTRTICIQCDLE